MESEPKDIEPGTFRDACSRAILELIIIPLRKKFGDTITVMWPVEERVFGEESTDFTRAYILFKKRSIYEMHIAHADMGISFVEDNLYIVYKPTSKTNIVDFWSASIANPDVHTETILFVSNIIGCHHAENSPS